MLCAHSGTSAGANRVLNMATWHRTRRLEIEAGNEAGRSHGPVAVNSALGSRVRRWYTKRLCKRDGHIHSRPKMDDPQDEDSSVSSHSCTCHKSCACACTCCVCGVDCQSSVWTTQCRSEHHFSNSLSQFCRVERGATTSAGRQSFSERS